jgi:pimeloyl-ACP methyl ester carboxylesterase
VVASSEDARPEEAQTWKLETARTGSKPQIMLANICSVLAVLLGFLGLLGFHMRAPPAHPATVAEIEADGGKWIRTEEGRLIEYFTCGAPSGTPCYIQHGYGNTGKFTFVVPELCEAADRLGLRLISPSQPGFGLSSTYPLDRVRTLREWPADVDLILRQENVDDFYVSGFSAGCVHALTVAHAFGDRVLGVGIFTPTTPLEVEQRTNGAMALPTKVVRNVFVYPYFGDLLGYLMSLMDGRSRMAAAPDVLAALVKMETKAVAGEPKWGRVARGFIEDQNRGMVKGFRGWQDNMAILNEDVPFDTQALASDVVKKNGRKLIITTSPDDTTNPPVMQEWWKENLPGSELMHVKPLFDLSARIN